MMRSIGGTAVCVILSAAGCSGGASSSAISGVTDQGVSYSAVGTGDPVVLIHGFSLDRRMWDPQLTALADRYRVIRYDLRGHGASGAPTGPFAAYDDLAAVMDSLDVAAATIVGHSAGAQIALDFALTYPRRVKKLVLVSPGVSGYVPREPFTWFEPVGTALQAGDLELAARLWAETPLMAVTDTAVASSIRTIVVDNARLWSYQREDRPPTPPAVARLAEVTGPVLVILGGQDLADIHGAGDTLVTCIAGARKLVIPDGRHMVSMSAAAAVNEALLSFLRERDARPGHAGPSPCA